MAWSLEALVALALAEDLGDRGDVTGGATVAEDAVLDAAFVARSPGVLAGLDAAEAVFTALSPAVSFTRLRRDGDRLEAGTVLARVIGPARAVLAGERTALNFLTHLSGVATLTARYAAELDGTGAVVRDTRKTMPGMRALEKAAVAAGGGTNHRAGLHDGFLVKDNHVAAAGSVAEATRRALEAATGHGGLEVQVEVDTMEQLAEALEAGARSVLLDNFDLRDLPAAVTSCREADGAVFIEVSGGVTLENLWAIGAAGVDAVAVGALTHSAPALDIGLDIDVLGDVPGDVLVDGGGDAAGG
jgi:nicotinate-nucleotide pyrophosphorylase (carboxylating)